MFGLGDSTHFFSKDGEILYIGDKVLIGGLYKGEISYQKGCLGISLPNITIKHIFTPFMDIHITDGNILTSVTKC